MRKLLIAALLMIGCSNEKIVYKDRVIHDTVIVMKDKPIEKPDKRFFLVSYTYYGMNKDSSKFEGAGYASFITRGAHISVKYFEDYIYRRIKYKNPNSVRKHCTSIITNIYEVKSENDYCDIGSKYYNEDTYLKTNCN